MGLNLNGVRALLHAQLAGVDFSRTATIGRQELQISRDNLAWLLGPVNWNLDDLLRDGYAENLLNRLGAKTVTSFDNFERDEPTYLVDLNEPIKSGHLQSFSFILDGGSLEHIFNVPQAFKNVMSMVDIGGHFLGIWPADRHMGHGYFQFSPDLMFGIFNERNGFRMIDVILYEDPELVDPRLLPDGKPASLWHRQPMLTPDGEPMRSPFMSNLPVYMIVLAQRVSDVPIFAQYPQDAIYPAAQKG